MTAKASWFLRLPEILRELDALNEVEVLDRASLERMFGVRRRRANQLMLEFGGFAAGNMLLVSRTQLIAHLRKLEHSQEFRWEQRRRRRLVESLDEARRHLRARQVRIRVPEETAGRCMNDLPAGIRLARGELVIHFSSAEDLLSKLFELSQAVSNDFERFMRAVE